MLPSPNTKQPFDIHIALDRVREAVRPFPKAAMFALADEGFQSPFEQLIACIISIRTFDETSLPVARQLLSTARTPEEMSRLTPAQIDQLIQASTYHESKAQQIWAIAHRLVTEFDGQLPCDLQTLLSFAGVGPKCAHLTLGIACHQPYISVDIHVHRVTNRWGYVHTRTPEKTLNALETQLPQEYWIEINQLLVPFGKHICSGTIPHCSTCPVLPLCPQMGVTRSQ